MFINESNYETRQQHYYLALWADSLSLTVLYIYNQDVLYALISLAGNEQNFLSE